MSELALIDKSTGELLPVSALRRELARSETAQDLRNVEHAGQRMRDMALLAGQSAEQANEYAKVMIEACAGIGRMLGEAQHVPGPGRGNKEKASGATDAFNNREQVRSYRALSRALTLWQEDTEKLYAKLAEKQDTISKAKILAMVKTLERDEDVARQREAIREGEVELPQGVYSVIDIDPPWPYGNEIDVSGYDAQGHRASNPYPEMPLEEILALPVPEHAAPDCVLWLWTTHRFMRHSFALLDGWGFRDVAILTWVKDRMGLGRWLRSQSEFCIMAIRGKPGIQLSNQTTVLHGPMREHSRKPDEFYAMVEEPCPAERRLIWFGREPRDGWAVGGNEPEKFS